MKILMHLFFLFSVLIYGQDCNNGTISMELNNNLIEMPIVSVEIEKKTAIHFRIKANLKDEFKNQSILLIFAADVLMPDSVKSDEFKIEILNEINTATKAEKYDLS